MKKTYQRGTSLNAVILDKLVEVFRALNWKVKNENRFTLFCKALSRLESEEQLLIIELTRDFLHCDLSQYPSAIKQVIDKTVYVMPQNIQEVIAVPLVKPKNVGKVKSGSFLIYLLDQELNQFARAKIPKFSSVDRCSVLGDKKDRRNTLVLFVDDFLGSGKTAKEALDEYNKKYKKEDDVVLVAALVAQQNAVNLLKELGIESVYAHLRGRGISDSAKFLDKAYALNLIDQIEARLGVSPNFQRGFEKSEALVCMLNKCPNNTFPVYWTNKKINGETWSAPFPR